MAAALEFRHYFRKFTLDDARAGVNPVRLNTGPTVNGQAPSDLFVPAVLQWRYKEKVHLNGAPGLEWTPWQTVPVALDGQDLAPAPA